MNREGTFQELYRKTVKEDESMIIIIIRSQESITVRYSSKKDSSSINAIVVDVVFGDHSVC